MWIAKRSLTKQTSPGLLDQISAGGVSSHQTALSTLFKEGWEEASLHPLLVASHAMSAGTISYTRIHQNCILPKIQHIYDVFLPSDFMPCPFDGEVSSFYLWPMDKVLC